MKTIIICLLAALFGFSSCEKEKTQPLNQKENLLSNENNAIDNSENREVDPFIQSLQGTWSIYTMIYYDKEWKEVESVAIEKGDSKMEGLGHRLYTFNTDGTFTYYLDPCYPGKEPEVVTYSCFYDSESKIITMKNDKGVTRYEYLVSGYDGEYLVLDYSEHLYDSYIDKHYYRYIRETLKKWKD